MSAPAAVARRVSILRRVVVGVIIVSFGVAAIGGIVVLLGAELGDAAARVLGTTAIVGAFSVAVLCCAALAGRPAQVFGITGAGVSVATAALVVWTIWFDGPFGPAWETLYRLMWTGVAASVAFALASLLLLLGDRHRAAVRSGLWITLALFAVVLGMVVFVIWWPDLADDTVFPRVLGISGILAALGAVVVPVISLLLRERGPRPGELSAETIGRIEAVAAERGLTPDDLVGRLLALDASPSGRPDVDQPDADRP